MFTGIIEEVGKVKQIRHGQNSAQIWVEAKTVLEGTKIGDSISVDGVCLTVTQLSSSAFEADIASETLQRSGLGSLTVNASVNLERAMKLNGRFGGHIVSGHIDGVGTILKIQKSDIAFFYEFEAPKNIIKYVIEKGSIAVDGISLTIAKVFPKGFSVSIIPHTLENTSLKNKKVGSFVNLEADIIGKYVEKLLGLNPASKNCEKNPITKSFLAENGFI